MLDRIDSARDSLTRVHTIAVGMGRVALASDIHAITDQLAFQKRLFEEEIAELIQEAKVNRG